MLPAARLSRSPVFSMLKTPVLRSVPSLLTVPKFAKTPAFSFSKIPPLLIKPPLILSKFAEFVIVPSVKLVSTLLLSKSPVICKIPSLFIVEKLIVVPARSSVSVLETVPVKELVKSTEEVKTPVFSILTRLENVPLPDRKISPELASSPSLLRLKPAKSIVSRPALAIE